MANVIAPVRSYTPGGSSGLKVVLFSGGRGSGALVQQLARSAVELTLAVNGYDDGASTGEVRRFLGDSLGPSDFRKNASRLAAFRGSCSSALITLLDLRLPENATREDAVATFRILRGEGSTGGDHLSRILTLYELLDGAARSEIVARIDAFEQELSRLDRDFNFSDCSLGNLVFAGSFLRSGRAFNDAVDDYCALVGLRPGVIDNVTDGTNAFLVALHGDGRLLATEEEIVDSRRQNRIEDIFLLDHPPTGEEQERLTSGDKQSILAFLRRHGCMPGPNPRLLRKLAAADVIVYAPGTQHSSLFPSYLTPGISEAVAANLRAAKLMITNIRADAEITGSSAAEIMQRAVHYMRQKGRLSIPVPCLVTHCLINDPATSAEPAYVPLGRLDTLDDPRLVRVGDYEDGLTGLHHASRVLNPYLQGRPGARPRPRIAVFLHDARSADGIVQTILEMVRAGIEGLPVNVTVLFRCQEPVDPEFVKALPFETRNLATSGGDEPFHQILERERFDYVVLFESSGMYLGEDAVRLIAHVAFGQLDAVWGSRRLSARKIQESVRLRYRHNLLLRVVSQAGSQLLSVMYLVLFRRYVSDSLSAARAIRADYVRQAGADPADKQVNHHILSALLRDGAELIETPVSFCSLSPERVRRTTVRDGLNALLTMMAWRLKPRRRVRRAVESASDEVPVRA